MQKQQITLEPREGLGKNNSRRLRKTGMVPAVVYGGEGATAVSVNRKELVRILNSPSGAATLLSIRMPGATQEKLAIVREFQTDPIKHELIHADLLEVAADKPIHVTVAVVLTGSQPRGVKAGGILQHPTRELAIECLPMQIPEHIEVDASALEIGGSIHLADLKLPEGVKPLADLDHVVVMIAAPVSAEKLEQMLAGGEAAEVKEPEVVAKGKAEEEEGSK